MDDVMRDRQTQNDGRTHGRTTDCCFMLNAMDATIVGVISLPKVIWEERVATPHVRECTLPQRVLAVACTMRNEALWSVTGR